MLKEKQIKECLLVKPTEVELYDVYNFGFQQDTYNVTSGHLKRRK